MSIRIPQANWRQDPVSLVYRLTIGDFVLYVGKDWIVRRATDRGHAIVSPGSKMPPPLAQGPESGDAGMIAAEDAAAALMGGPLPKGG